MWTRRSHTRSETGQGAVRRGGCAAVHFLPRLAALLLLTAGLCDMRDPPPPCDPITDTTCRPPALFAEPLTPEVVRDNVKRALEGPTVDPNYRDSLTGTAAANGGIDFVYIPDEAVLQVNPELFDGWGREREVQFMLNLLEVGENRPRQVRVTFLDFFDTGEISDPDRARYRLQYEITLTFVDSSVDPPGEDERRFCGEAIWDLQGGTRNFWRLQRWEELFPLSLTGDPSCEGTLGQLRLERGLGG